MDKSFETKIARQVYAAFDHELMPCEGPDFILSTRKEISLGVEVTEFYDSESDARLKNVDGYATELIAGGSVRHKDDRAIRVEEVTYESPSRGISREIKAIIREVPPFDESLTRLCSILERKQAKLLDYQSKVPDCDLIIHDADGRFSFDSMRDIWRCVVRHNIINVLRESNFREVFLVTLRGEKPARVVVPLRANVIGSQIVLLRDIIAKDEAVRDFPAADRMRVFFSSLVSAGFGRAMAWVTPNHEPCLRFGSVDITLSKTGIQMMDNFAVALPTDAKPLASEVRDFRVNPNLISLVETERTKGLASMELFFAADATG